MGAETFISDLRESVVAMTEADPYFLDVPILTEKLKDIASRVEKTVALTNGICVVIVTPGIAGPLQNVPGANFTGIVLAARVLEKPPLNATGKAALDVAVKIYDLWCQSKPDTHASALKPQPNPVTLGNDERFISYDVFFETEAGMRGEIPRLAVPTANVSNLAEIALASATPGAATFRTLDGSAPIPRNPAAVLYTAPFAGTAGQMLRARAWLAGYLPSPELKITLT